MWPWRTSTFLRWLEPDGFMGTVAGQWRHPRDQVGVAALAMGPRSDGPRSLVDEAQVIAAIHRGE